MAEPSPAGHQSARPLLLLSASYSSLHERLPLCRLQCSAVGGPHAWRAISALPPVANPPPHPLMLRRQRLPKLSTTKVGAQPSPQHDCPIRAARCPRLHLRLQCFAVGGPHAWRTISALPPVANPLSPPPPPRVSDTQLQGVITFTAIHYRAPCC